MALLDSFAGNAVVTGRNCLEKHHWLVGMKTRHDFLVRGDLLQWYYFRRQGSKAQLGSNRSLF